MYNIGLMAYGSRYLWLDRIPPNASTMDNSKSIPTPDSADFALIKVGGGGVLFNTYVSYTPGSTIPDLHTLRSVPATVSRGACIYTLIRE